MHDSLSAQTSLLLRCAVFECFDPAMLRAVLELDDAMVRAVLDAPQVHRRHDGAWALLPSARRELLARLQEEAAPEEYRLHLRAFNHVLERLAADEPEAPWLADACLHHLEALSELNLNYMRLNEIADLIRRAQTVADRLTDPLRDRLTLLEAYLAFRQSNYEHSVTLIEHLLQRENLPLPLRSEALIIRGLNAMNRSSNEEALADFMLARDLGIAADDEALQARALVNASCVYNYLQRFDQALDLSRQGLMHARSAGDRYGTAFAMYMCANNAIYSGHWESAMADLEEVAAIYRAAEMHTLLAAVEWLRGFLHQILGHETESVATYERALVVAEAEEHGNLVLTADILTELGLVYQIQGRWDDADKAFRRAIVLQERLRNDLSRALVMHRYAQFLSRRGAHEDAMATLRAAVDLLETLRVTTRAEDLKICLLGTAEQVYETVVLACLERGDLAEAFAYVERARARAFLDLVARRDAPDNALAQRPTVTLADVQRQIAPDAIVLEYFCIGVLPRGDSFLTRIAASNPRLRDLTLHRPQILLFAITRETAQVWRIDFDPNRLQPSAGDPTPGWHLITQRKLRWMYDRLIAPAEPLLRNCTVMHIIPHGPLHYVPFAALATPHQGTLLDPAGPVLTYAPSATVLCACLTQSASAGEQNLTIGYNYRGEARLFLAEHEAQIVGAMLQAHVLAGAQPKRGELLAAGPRVRNLHIASHAVYRADDPMGSYLCLGDGDDLDARTLMQALHLREAVVTLNACMSGLSHIASGDELLGLPRAFLYAGAATIICALHEIDDIAAYVLMVLYYTNLAEGLSPAEALHRAQITIRDADRDTIISMLHRSKGATPPVLAALERYERRPFAHPRFWATFILIGRP